MIYKHKEGKTVFQTPGVKGILIAEEEAFQIVELTLEEGGDIDEHPLPEPITFYVSRGKGIVTVNGTPETLEKGDVVTVPPGALRKWTNKGPGELVVIGYKTKT